jgi:hypothetical protein
MPGAVVTSLLHTLNTEGPLWEKFELILITPLRRDPTAEWWVKKLHMRDILHGVRPEGV